MCGSGKRITCIVDGDTFWFEGEKIRVQGYDTPEPQTGLCGGRAERELAHQASKKFMEIMNSGSVSIFRTGTDRYGRTLANVTVNGVDVGDALIAEGLARRYPDGCEFWCRSCE